MKKIALMIVALLTICLSASSQTKKQKESKGTKVLVAYFSATGTTKAAAQQLAEVTKATLHEIKPEQPYTDADLDWRNKQSRSSMEMKDKSSRPAITGKLKDIKKYDVIYVGFPIWWNTCPTSGGSSIKQSCEDLKNAYPNLNWKEGKLLNRASKKDIEDWVKGL